MFQRSFQGRPPDRKVALREEALNLCERNLADSEIGLWPFPSVQPSVGGAIGVVPHVQFAMFGQIDELRALLDETPELIDQPNDRGLTCLMAAAHGGYAAVVAVLLERGADVARRDARGVSALDYAVREHRQEALLTLLKHSESRSLQLVNAVDPEGNTLLMVAAERGHKDLLPILLEAKADPNMATSVNTPHHLTTRGGVTALMIAAHHGYEQIAHVLLEAGAIVDTQLPDRPDIQLPDGRTALMIAAKLGRERCAHVLLKAKADPNKATSDGVTALMLAAQHGHEPCIRDLLEAGAVVNAPNFAAVTALILAAEKGHEPCVHVLLEAKADPNKAKSDGATALILAAESGRPCVRVLLEAKANPNKARSDGWTALMIAAQDGHEPCVHVLLESKADPNQMNCAGRTASMIASERGHERCSRVLLEAYFNPYQAKGGGGGRAGGKGGGTVRSTRCVAPICTFFARNGQCRYGDRCRFIHDRGGAASG